MNSEQPRPEILQADWPRAQVLRLFDDLAAGATVSRVQLRTATADAAASLSEAKTAFDTGTALAIQIRYRFADEFWCDTILPGPSTNRVIRNRLAT